MPLNALLNLSESEPASSGNARLVILGGGVAGLTIAKLLAERGFNDFEIIEKADRVGGKSETISASEVMVEMGTCYTTPAHQDIRRWMNKLRLRRKRLTRTLVDGEDYSVYVRKGIGEPLIVQVVRYLWLRKRLLRSVERDEVSQSQKDELALSTADWLWKNRLPKIERLMYRAMTSLGYGFLDETSILQAMRWVDGHTILAGAFHLLEMPLDGWSVFWSKLSEEFRVLTNAEVASVVRSKSGIRLQLADGQIRAYDYLLNTLPLDELARLTPLSEAEARISSAIDWKGFATSLVTSNSWFRETNISAYSKAFLSGAAPGAIISARHEGFSKDENLNYYVVGQLPGPYDRAELQEILVADLLKLGVSDGKVVTTRVWKYFPCYDRASIRRELLDDMSRVQGESRTWHTGATFSHESVANICQFNSGLAAQIAPALRRAKARSGAASGDRHTLSTGTAAHET
jgi:Flavin containing amine oxidoreductase